MRGFTACRRLLPCRYASFSSGHWKVLVSPLCPDRFTHYYFSTSASLLSSLAQHDRNSHDHVERPKRTPARNYFVGESVVEGDDKPDIDLPRFNMICGYLLNPDGHQISEAMLKDIYRLPATSLAFRRGPYFVKNVLLPWWRIFAPYFDLRPAEFQSDGTRTPTQLVVVLNSLFKLNRLSEGMVIEQLGLKRLQMLTDAVLENAVNLPFRSMAMAMKAIYTLVLALEGVSEQSEMMAYVGTVYKPTTWSTAKLGRFMTKFYNRLLTYDPTDDPLSYIRTDNIFYVVSYAYKLGMDSPINPTLPEQSEKIGAKLSQVILHLASPDYNANSAVGRIITLVKLTQVCVHWNFDPEFYGPNGKEGATMWSNVFEEMAAYLKRTSFDLDPNRVKLRSQAMALCLIAACKFDRELQFASLMRDAWSSNVGPRTFNRTQRTVLMHHVKQSKNCGKVASKYSESGCYLKLFDILNGSAA